MNIDHFIYILFIYISINNTYLEDTSRDSKIAYDVNWIGSYDLVFTISRILYY